MLIPRSCFEKLPDSLDLIVAKIPCYTVTNHWDTVPPTSLKRVCTIMSLTMYNHEITNILNGEA